MLKDPILGMKSTLNDIDECNKWLVDDDNDNEEEEMSWFLMMIPLLIGQLFIKLQVLENQ